MTTYTLETFDGVTQQAEIEMSWAKLFLKQWNRAVKLWNKGELFAGVVHSGKSINQKEYAKICCTWLIPNGFVEPHCVAEGR